MQVCSQLITFFLIDSLKKTFEKERKTFFVRGYYGKLKPDIVASCLKIGKYGHLKEEQAKEIGAKFVDINSVYHLRTIKIINILGLE